MKPEDMEPAKLIEAVNVLEFPSLVRQDLVLHYVTGEDLTPGTTEYLKKLWQEQGADDEFEYWVENLF